MDFSDETRIRLSGRRVAHGSPPGFGVSPSVGVTRLTHADHTEETAERETAARVPAGLIAPEVTIDRVFYRRLTRGAVHVRGAGVPT